MGNHRDPIKVKRSSGGGVSNRTKLTKEQRAAHILLKEGINYIENENIGTIKSDEYVRRLLFDQSNEDAWGDDDERHLKVVRVHRSGNERESCQTNGESPWCGGALSNEGDGNRTKGCSTPPHKQNSCNEEVGKTNGIVTSPLLRTHEGVISKRGLIGKRTIGKMKRGKKKTPCGSHRGGKLPLKVQKRGISQMNPEGGESPQQSRKVEDSQRCRRRTHFSPFQKETIATHKKEPLPFGELNNQFVNIHFNRFRSICVEGEDLSSPIGVDSLLGANTRKSFSCAHNVSTPFYGPSCLSCVEMDRQRNFGEDAVGQRCGSEGGESSLGEGQRGGFPSRGHKMEDFPSKENGRKKSLRDSHRGAHHPGRTHPPKDGMCHSVNALLCRSRNKDLFNERNNEIMVNERGGGQQRGGSTSSRGGVARGGPNMDVSFASDLRGVQIALPDVKSRAFQAGTVLSQGNSGGKQQVEQKTMHPQQPQQPPQPPQPPQPQFAKRERPPPDADKAKAQLNELANAEKRREMENAYVKYIYKRDESEEAPAEKRDRFVTFGGGENDSVNMGEVPDRRKSTQRRYKDQLSSVINLRYSHADRTVHGFGETLKFMKYRELLRKYMGTFYNYSSVKCATYIILYALIVKIITQVSKNLTAPSSGGLPTEKSNDVNIIWYSDSNLFLNVHDVDGIIQSVCYASLLVCIFLLLKLGMPSNYLLAGRLTILFLFFFFAQIPIMIYANFMALKKEEGIAKSQAKAFDKRDYFNLHMQRVYDVFYVDTLNLLVYTILMSLVSIYATYHKLIYPHLLKFYLDSFFLCSYTIVKKEVIQFRVPNNVDAYYLNQVNSYLFNSLYKKQGDLSQDDLESNTRSAIGYNVVIKKERCSLFARLFRRNAPDQGGHAKGIAARSGRSGRSARSVPSARSGINVPSARSGRSTRAQSNPNVHIIFYIGELDDQGRPHGFGYWRGINLEGEVLIGYWFHGIPVGPFKCRDFKTGSGFMCIKIGYGRTSCEPKDLDIGKGGLAVGRMGDEEIRRRDEERQQIGSPARIHPPLYAASYRSPPTAGLADTECCVSGAFYRTFPRVVFYNLNLTTPNRRSKKNDQGRHGIMEKRECCEYLHISRASNDILRVDYAKLLQDSEDDRAGEADPVRPDEENKIDDRSEIEGSDSERLRGGRIMGGGVGRRGMRGMRGRKGRSERSEVREKREVREGGERRLSSAPGKEHHRRRPSNRPTMTYDEVPPSIVNDESFLKGELLNYDDICNLSYDLNELTLDSETNSLANRNAETGNPLAEGEQQERPRDQWTRHR
ncbi:hypothetical protein, conserved [Plasmodium vivax]|uniref:Uncharacterized protein n=1 Tax=Plasmodium vivax (strain Salvador I) TaxID=126793 RepID=A5KAA4_PLAVS|nr:hypothetical protein, conserved [Plasmodium vivax]EDL43740.1 hypothetical protein, conserved [Plasmodium vivax]|eukprot:XP_001613467.1 hypothetical protein [Plasmodium vivax Sal-1]